jgi:hypothetical protein
MLTYKPQIDIEECLTIATTKEEKYVVVVRRCATVWRMDTIV